MKSCSNFVYLSMFACQLAECLSDDELALLVADLSIFTNILSAIIVEKEISEKNKDNNNIEETTFTEFI